MLKTLFPAFIGLFGLASCGQPTPVLITPPADLAICASMPPAPDLPERTADNQLERDQMVLDYVLALRSAYGDCAAKVAGLAAWIEEASE